MAPSGARRHGGRRRVRGGAAGPGSRRPADLSGTAQDEARPDLEPSGDHRWLTVVGPGEPDGVELVLEPDAHPAARVFKAALVADGIPFTSFGVDDARAEHARLVALGVRFTQEPLELGPMVTAVLDDTCGNLIQIASMA
ncbi:MAG TPA: VOC family protein [Cellulomonas sp.]|nr:VOC family protein [Cellulomonas sp.]HEX5333417.1 VOC family protein [Cellulomonas sp.]